jgi:site-specific recombinase XerC
MAAGSTLVRYEHPLDVRERTAVAGFLAGYSGNTRVCYATDLRLFAGWCADQRLRPLEVRRSHLEMFARTMEQEGRMRSTVARRLSTLCSFYRYCHLEGLLARNPAANVRRPKVDPESRTLGLDRNELGALLVQAGLGSPRDHALISLLAMNGLRISEALSVDIDDLDIDRGHRTLRVVRKGGKRVTVPLAPRTARALDLYIVERTTGPIFLGAGGGRMDRYAADRTVNGWPVGRGSPSGFHRTACATASSPPPSTPASPCGTCKKPPRTRILAPRCATTGPASRSTVTPPTSWRPSSPAPPADTQSTTGRYRASVSPGTGSSLSSL